MKNAPYIGLICIFAAYGFAQARPACYEDKDTNAYTCYDAGAVVERDDGIRISKMFKGGPLNVTDTGYFFAVNCESGMVHLKDHQGVSFGGGHKSATKAMTAIADWICAEHPKSTKKNKGK